VSRGPAGAPWPTATTRPVFLLGWPVHHSLSPPIHNAAFREHDLDLVYLVAPTPPEALADVVASLATVGAVGANVTVPHKQAVAELCDVRTEEAELIGAVNTLVWTTEGLLGDNTDATGLREAITAEVAVAPGEAFLVLGSGGAARAAVVAVGRLGGRLQVVARRADAAKDLAELGMRAGAVEATAVDLHDEPAVAAATSSARIVVNATPLGMGGEALPAPLMELEPGQVAYDLVYDPPETPFLQAAHRRGVDAHHGLGMLVAQAAASYRRWTGVDAPEGLMSAVAMAALTERLRRA
jgi:shikimate dehydrogenase